MSLTSSGNSISGFLAGPLGSTSTSNALGLTLRHADYSPVITSVQLLDIDTGTVIAAISAGGQAYAILYGTSFGPAQGSMAICPSGANPCQTSDLSGSITFWSDGQVNLLLTAAETSTGNYDAVLTSLGSAGTSFVQAPQGPGPQSNRGTIAAVVCSNGTDAIVKGYTDYHISTSPACTDFTQTAHSEYFPDFSKFNSGDYSWALVEKPLIVPKSALYGLDRWRELMGSPQIINSAYRNPAHNSVIGGASNSRHMWGDAIDIRNDSQTDTEHDQKACAASSLNAVARGGVSSCPSQPDAGADYVEPVTLACHLACVHADWRDHDRNSYRQQ